ncbi:MAG TPA: secretin N-terminal domain-containing protein [Phycisphaerae bacterium]
MAIWRWIALAGCAWLLPPGIARAQTADPPASENESGLAQPAVNVSERGTVEMHVADMPLATVLQMLSLQSRRNIIAAPGVSGSVTANLYDVSFEEALDAILVGANAGYRTQGNFIYVYTREQLAEMAAREKAPATRVFRLSYISAADALAAVQPLLTPSVGQMSASKQPAAGVGPSAEEGGGNSTANNDYLIVSDYPPKLEQISRVLRELDLRPQQVLIEGTILRAELSNDNSLGIDFTLLGGVNLQMLGATSTGIQNVTLGQLPAAEFKDVNTNISTNFTAAVPPGGLSFGIIHNDIAAFVRALERVTNTSVIANPKVLALNKQKGQMIVGRRDGYLTTTVTETQTIQTVEFLETGTLLIFRPFIGNDGYVRMELHPKDSIGGLTAANLPFEQTTEVTTNVVVRDGQTILIGGLFRETGSSNHAQIPLLGSIPLAGTLFKNQTDDTSREEVIILLSVHIVKDDAQYAAESRAQLENIERTRVGLRRKMMWNGRERLAQAYYRAALEQYARGHECLALWNVQIALHNNERSLSAIKLEEEIRGRRAWEDEGSITRDFLRGIIARERGIEEPPFGRPAPPFERIEAPRGPSGFEEAEPEHVLERH